MITTLKQAEERMALCYDRFKDNNYDYNLKHWETYVKYVLVEKIKEGDLIK